MLLGDVNVSAMHAFEVAPEVLHPVHMNIRAARQMIPLIVLFGAMAHELEPQIILLCQEIMSCLVGVANGARDDMLVKLGADRCAAREGGDRPESGE